MDTLAPRIREANRVGQNLIQSAAPRVSTTQLETDLEAMNDRWNKLKSAVSPNLNLPLHQPTHCQICLWCKLRISYVEKHIACNGLPYTWVIIILSKQKATNHDISLSLALQNSDREAKLNEGLLRCGKFQEALNSLMSWIGETEELVSHQKDASSDYKVVKAQLSEQLVRRGLRG